MNRIHRPFALFIVVASMSLPSCNALREADNAAAGISRCSFRLDGISNFRLAGVQLYGKTSLDVTDATAALTSFAQGEMPVSFILNVAVKNPTAGPAGPSSSALTLVSLSWTLLIDDVTTVEGDIPQPMKIPSSGEQTIVPVWMKFDLLRFFKAERYEKLVDLALALGGARGSTSRVTLRAKPTIRTEFGDLVYPGEIDIVGKEFREE